MDFTIQNKSQSITILCNILFFLTGWGGVSSVLDHNIVGNEFEHQSCHYVHFHINNLGEKAWILLYTQITFK